MSTSSSSPTMSSVGKWLAGMAVLTAAVVLMSEAPDWEPLAVALVALLAVSLFFAEGSGVLAEVDRLFGTSMAPA